MEVGSRNTGLPWKQGASVASEPSDERAAAPRSKTGQLCTLWRRGSTEANVRRHNGFYATPPETLRTNQRIAERGASLGKIRFNVLFVLPTAESRSLITEFTEDRANIIFSVEIILHFCLNDMKTHSSLHLFTLRILR